MLSNNAIVSIARPLEKPFRCALRLALIPGFRGGSMHAKVLSRDTLIQKFGGSGWCRCPITRSMLGLITMHFLQSAECRCCSHLQHVPQFRCG